MITLVLGASALAIGLLVVLNIIIGGWSPALLRTEQDVEASLRNGVFGFRARRPIVFTADGQGALALEEGGDRLGLAVSFGDRVTVRALKPGDVAMVSRDSTRLTLHLNDYTLPTATLRYPDAETAERVEGQVRGFAAEDGFVIGELGRA